MTRPILILHKWDNRDSFHTVCSSDIWNFFLSSGVPDDQSVGSCLARDYCGQFDHPDLHLVVDFRRPFMRSISRLPASSIVNFIFSLIRKKDNTYLSTFSTNRKFIASQI